MDGTAAGVASYFDLSPETWAFRSPRPLQIQRRRTALGELLLFDILLSAGGIRQPETLYPPVDIDSFHRLIDAIQSSQYDALKRDCLVYFLLKWYQDGREDKFRIDKCIPPQFTTLADAYWHLDSGNNIPRAVSILSDARLNTDYASKILQAISLSPNSMPLVLKYVRTAKPLLTEPDDIDLYTIALADANLFEAWQFQRTFSERHETRPRLLKKILDWCFTPLPRRKALVQLLGIALIPYEQTLMQSYATPPSALPPAGVATLQNLICVRLIQTGSYSDAIKMDRQFTSASSTNLGPQAERTKMVQDLYAALQLAERAILDLELENPGIQASTSEVTDMSGSSSREWDMSMSWEDVQAPIPPAAPTSIPPLPSVQIPPIAGLSSSMNGARNTPPRSKFGGFGSQTPSAFPPLAFNASSSSSRPLAPIIPVSNVPKGPLGAQAPVPSARQPLNAPTNAFSSLSQSTSRFAAPSGSSAASPGQRSLFDSAGRKPNAFYQPPLSLSSAPRTNDAADTGADSDAAKARENTDIEMDQDEHLDGDRDGAADEESLAYSVFSSKPVRSFKRAGVARARQTSVETKTKQVPPGAFVTDDDEQEPDFADPPPPPPPRQTRRTAAKTGGVTQPAKTPATRTRARAKGQELGRSLPGSLMGSEDGSADEAEEEEDGDRLAPLPRRQTQAATGDGVPPRRRSSRLSSSETESRPEKEKPSGRTRTGGGRKKRT
ncbi:nuclear pore complex assembly-domain-containing protein [Mycena filopes]|nr:nuclear pore complex assembly-domain-containing protein [Mycena filopes]